MSDTEKKKEIEDPSKTFRKKALGAAAAVTTGAAVLVNSAFGSPEELIKPDEQPQHAIVYDIGDESAEEDEDDEEEEEEEAPSTFWGRIRQRIWTWPRAVRILIGLPLWALGWGVCQICQALWGLVLSPVLKAVWGVFALFAVLAGVLGLAGRAAFPELPLREVFKKSRLIALAVCSVLLETLLAILPAVDDKWEAWTGLLRFGGGAVILCGLMLSLWVTQQRRKRYVLGT